MLSGMGAGRVVRIAVRLRALAAIFGARGGTLALGCIILLSLVFRLHVSSECSLWVDEAITRRGLSKPWPEILKGPSEAHPPLMYWLVAPVVQLFGANDTALRAVSLFFGCVLLAATYELAVELGLSTRRALFVVASLALSSFFIRHATEARHYAIFAAFVILATTRTLRGLRPHPRATDLIGFAAAALAAAATHYFGVAYALALLLTLGVGTARVWRQSRPAHRRGLLVMLSALLASLGWLASRALALGRSYGAGAGGTETKSLFDVELLLETLREFSFLSSNDAWSLVLQPLLALIGVVNLGLQLRGLARLLPFGIGVAPCLLAPLLKAQHFVAARYVAPSLVFYQLAVWVALFALIDRTRIALTRGPRSARLAPLLGWVALSSLLVARLREYPNGFGAGADDYRGLQSYFATNLAQDTRLVSYSGGFGALLFGRMYPIGSRPLPLEKFRPVRHIKRYLVVEIHADGPERRLALESLIEEHFGLSPEEWRALPLVPLPHSVYQRPVPARLVHLSKRRTRKHR